MTLRTALSDRLGIEHPIVQAPMAGGWTTPALVAAVSEAGGLGTLAAARITAGQLREQIAETRRRTGRPFGVNFQLAAAVPEREDDPRARELLADIRAQLGLPAPAAVADTFVSVEDGIEIALEAGVPIISMAMGSPARWSDRVHAAGALLVAAATTVADARELERAGADAIVAQGAEAGGHRSLLAVAVPRPVPLVGTMALVPAVVNAVRVPVLAAGGIMDGRGVVAALALGASGVQLGTRFLLALESGAPASYRRRLLDAVETDTTVTAVYTGRPARGLRNAFIDRFERAGVGPLGWPRMGAAALDIFRASQVSDAEWTPVFAGQGAGLIRREQPAAEIVRELVAEAAAVRERLST